VTPYTTIFEYYRICVETWAAGDVDAHVAHTGKAPKLSADETAKFVQDFCSRAGRHVEEIGADAVGWMIWYLMGSGEQVWFEVEEASQECAEDAILALRHLYERCFAIHLTEWGGVGSAQRRLATACYMLWDMDGGLESIPMFKGSKSLAPACYSVLEYALSLDSIACWESALHGLGHIVLRNPEPAQGMIDAFLAAKGRRVPDDLRQYALSARGGGVQ
jgi:hypothetical protein